MGFVLEGIDHVAIQVSDTERSVGWYRDVLGLERRHQDVWGDFPAMMFKGTTGIALFPKAGAPGASDGPSLAIRHIAFRTDRGNFAKAQSELSKRGIHYAFEDHEIAHSIYFADPDGHQLEITTYDMV